MLKQRASSSARGPTSPTPPVAAPAAAPSADGSAPSADAPKLLVDDQAKWRSARTRVYTSLLMITGFIFIFSMGHVPLCIFVIFLQSAMFREIVRLGMVLKNEKELPGFQALHWFWFATAVFFQYGRMLSRYFGIRVPYHSFISFSMYSAGLVFFVLSLKPKKLKYQFGMFAWCHLTLLLVVVQSSFLVINMFQGLIWFIMPSLLIISNDSWAYVFGFFFGRTPLISISPKKTWEGFIGATFATLITGFLLSRFLSMFQLMICPKTDLSFDYPTCELSDVFTPVAYALPGWLMSILQTVGLNWSFITIAPIQWHGLVLAVFASIVAPFGGFFASGFKRAFNLKDFGESIPGHGGVTDRMDCQIMNGLFVFVYYWSFVNFFKDANSIFHAFSALPADQQLRAWSLITEALKQKAMLPAGVVLP